MARSKHHNFSIGLKQSYKKIKDKHNTKVTIYLFYVYGTKPIKKSTGIRVPAIVYNPDTKRIKQSYTQYRAYNDILLNIESKIPDVRAKMMNGKMTYRSAFMELLNKSEEYSIQEFVKHTAKINAPTKDKYFTYLSALNGHFERLNRPEYVDLKFNILDDANEVETIADIIKNKVSSIEVNTQIDYMNALDTCYKKYKNLKGQEGVFRQGGYIPAKQDPNVQPVSFLDLAKGISKINTKQQYMSYLFWLYSFCLRGLDGQDIVNISEKHIKGDFDYNKHYYPDALLHKDLNDQNKKAWYIKRRKKSNTGQIILINIFPTLLIHRLLKQAIKETHPQYSYKGQDKMRIFNFLTKDEDDKRNVKGFKKWCLLSDTLYKNYSKLFNGNLKRVRHTFVQTAVDELGTSYDKANELLGHKIKKQALKFYLSESQLNTDIYHIHTIQEFDILRLLKTLIDYADHKEYVKREKHTGGLIDTLNEEHNSSVYRYNEWLMFDVGLLTTWELDKEMKLQKLMRKIETRPKVKFENGVVSINDDMDYSDDLKKLIKEKEKIFEESKYFKSYIEAIMIPDEVS